MKPGSLSRPTGLARVRVRNRSGTKKTTVNDLRLGPSHEEKADGYFGRNLAFWRKERHLSEKVAAKRLGVAESTWPQWESGRRAPSVGFMPLLGLVLGLPPCALVTCKPAKCLACVEVASRWGRTRDDHAAEVIEGGGGGIGGEQGNPRGEIG